MPSVAKEKLIVSADASEEIGSGHVMRCLSIAEAATTMGMETLFVVSSAYAAKMVEERGYACFVSGRPELGYGQDDAAEVVDICSKEKARFLLVDSYAVNPLFFDSLRAGKWGLKVAYVDDAYTFGRGFSPKPCRHNVDMIVNYSFGFSRCDYADAYSDSGVEILAGPSFAPVSSRFAGWEYLVKKDVERVLVTSGSTNPDKLLEAFVGAVRMAIPGVGIDVAVGPNAEIDEKLASDKNLIVHRGVSDLSRLMAFSDMAVSAAGSTLYELSCIGVPTVAVPIVENQLVNAIGFEKSGLGRCARNTENNSGLVSAIRSVANDFRLRSALSSAMRGLVDGYGAKRILEGFRRL